MLYMVGKIFLYDISVNIVYNELVHENMKKFEYLFFSQSLGKKYQSFKNRDGGAWNSTVLSYTSNSDYYLEPNSTNDLYLLGDDTSITNQEVPVLSSIPDNFIGQLSSILTNNLNLNDHIWW